MLDEVLAVATVDPHLADAGVVGGDLVQEPDAGGVGLHACCGGKHGKQQSEGVGDDVPFLADDLLPGNDALADGGNAGGGLDALDVDHVGSRVAASTTGPRCGPHTRSRR